MDRRIALKLLAVLPAVPFTVAEVRPSDVVPVMLTRREWVLTREQQRALYQRALSSGWLSAAEVRAMEDLPSL